MDIMKRNWFELHYNDATEHEFVVKIRNECTKNHKEVDQPINSAVMVENKDDRQCPVRSFKMYISHLHPFLTTTTYGRPPTPNPQLQ